MINCITHGITYEPFCKLCQQEMEEWKKSPEGQLEERVTSNKITCLWISSQSASDKFKLLAIDAEEHPEHYNNVIIVTNGINFDYHVVGKGNVSEILGLLEWCKAVIVNKATD